MVGLQFSGQIPGFDMAVRYGPDLNVGMPIFFKTGKNLLIGVEANYFYGSSIRETIMSNLLTSSGSITDLNGNPGAIRMNERGADAFVTLGKVFNKLGPNKNSGLMIMVGAGYIGHKIDIVDLAHNIPQIEGNYVKGYDRLTGGPAASQFVGYLFLSKRRMINLYFGFEFIEGFTTGLRSYQYDLMGPDNKRRFDLLSGFRLGWILPMYLTRAEQKFYYY